MTPTTQHYWKKIELREEGGTPQIIGSIRAGLAIHLKEAVGAETIEEIESAYSCKIVKEWRGMQEVDSNVLRWKISVYTEMWVQLRPTSNGMSFLPPTHMQLYLAGPQTVPKLPTFSFVVRHVDSGRFLHHNFVSSVLNDVFGIQSRGGCMCAGPYAQVKTRSTDT